MGGCSRGQMSAPGKWRRANGPDHPDEQYDGRTRFPAIVQANTGALMATQRFHSPSSY